MHGKRGASTRAVHAGRRVDERTGAVTPSLELSTTFARRPDGELMGEFLYGRHDNPSRSALEACLCDLESAAAAMVFASGSAVAHAIASSLASTDRLVVGSDMYFGIRHLLRELSGRGHFELLEVDLRDLDALRAACRAPRGSLCVMCETPTNPLLQVIDIAAVAALTHDAGGTLVVDNTLATPVLQLPLALGADLVMHSTTKFIGGHSDVLGGALLCRDEGGELWRRAHAMRKQGGAVPSPFDCWLLMRSIATLVLRVERQAATAARLAHFLADHPGVEDVLYPGLPHHPGHAVASRQMRLPGALLSVLVGGGEAGAARFTGGLRLFTAATSIGSVHSLAEHRARVEGTDTPTPRNLVRLSVGIEDYEDLAEDVASALASL